MMLMGEEGIRIVALRQTSFRGNLLLFGAGRHSKLSFGWLSLSDVSPDF